MEMCRIINKTSDFINEALKIWEINTGAIMKQAIMESKHNYNLRSLLEYAGNNYHNL